MNKKSNVKTAILVLGAMGILALCLFRVHRRHQVIRIGYELNEARNQLRTLHEDQNRLRLEESVLTNPGRIEKLASSLGMISPTPDQVRIVRTKSPLAFRNQ